MKITIQAHNWSAEVLHTDEHHPAEMMHVEVRTRAVSKEAALAAAVAVRDMFAKGRVAFIRVEPESESYVDFDTRPPVHIGYARFSYLPEPGDWCRGGGAIVNLSLGAA